mmetsp:Transcript_49932/g.56559  ORF Transcript_49932/g.56559 Transcript_49932/m.56559 type:complete len:269 (-) Transcript_49932:446-1252(-)
MSSTKTFNSGRGGVNESKARLAVVHNIAREPVNRASNAEDDEAGVLRVNLRISVVVDDVPPLRIDEEDWLFSPNSDDENLTVLEIVALVVLETTFVEMTSFSPLLLILLSFVIVEVVVVIVSFFVVLFTEDPTLLLLVIVSEEFEAKDGRAMNLCCSFLLLSSSAGFFIVKSCWSEKLDFDNVIIAAEVIFSGVDSEDSGFIFFFSLSAVSVRIFGFGFDCCCFTCSFFFWFFCIFCRSSSCSMATAILRFDRSLFACARSILATLIS